MSQHIISSNNFVFSHLRELVEKSQAHVFLRVRVFKKLIFFNYFVKDYIEITSTIKKHEISKNEHENINKMINTLYSLKEMCMEFSEIVKHTFPLNLLSNTLQKRADEISDVIEDLLIMHDNEIKQLTDQIENINKHAKAH